MRRCAFSTCVMMLATAPSAFAADTVDDLLKQARSAFMKGQTDEALKLATRAAELDPKDPQPWLVRGSLYDVLGRFDEAVADFTRVLELDPKAADVFDRRGGVQFKRGRIAESIADFDRFIALRPEEKNGHWRRGISYYYAGKFDEGKTQFEGYEAVDTNDVENAVWHFLCVARASGVEKARQSILKIGNDRRVPMSQIYDLFAGKLKPADVLAATKAGEPKPAELNQRLFYAHLYLGLYYEVTGDKNQALEHLARATDDHRIGHYMWDVARVHREILRKGMGGK